MANTTLLKNAKMTIMSFDGGRPLDVSISKRWNFLVMDLKSYTQVKQIL